MAANGDVDWAGAADTQEKSLVNKVGELNIRNAGDGGEEDEKPMSVAEKSLLLKV